MQKAAILHRTNLT